MEKHKCKLCFRSFSNGRALGGHMRSHMLNLPVPPKLEAEESPPPPQTEPPPPPLPPPSLPPELSDSAGSASSSSSSEEEETEDRELGSEDEKGLYYGLRENPKRSIKLVDPEFSFAVDAGSVILQDRESETESSKNPTRRRSKRTRKSGMLFEHHHLHYQPQYQKFDHHNQEETESLKKIKLSKLSRTESWAEPEPVSSVSDATTEEDVAFCLMMLSRDKWKRQEKNQQRVQEDEEQREEEEEGEEEEEEEEERSMEESDESEELKSLRTNVIRTRGKYKCETCKKVFRSYQALGGHRASHKKIKASNNVRIDEAYASMEQDIAGTTTAATTTSTLMVVEKKIHECPVCFRVFSSGQALGGHKRSHVTGSSATITATATATAQARKSSNKVVESFIDLNLPAPVDDDELSQIELSAVSDAEFVNAIRH